MSDRLKAKEGIILDQDGTVIFGVSGTSSRSRSGIAWGKTSGLLPKLILGGLVGAVLFFGFGLISVLVVVIAASIILRTLLGLIVPALKR